MKLPIKLLNPQTPMTPATNLPAGIGRHLPRRLTRSFPALALGSGLAAQATAAVISVGATIGALVPDADPSGRAVTVNVSDAGWRLADVNVTLSFSGNPAAFGGWNGDLYAWLSHDGALAVLLNRVGRSSADPLGSGYDDGGLSGVVFDDQAAADVHFYQTTLGFAPGVLTGSWQPDARITDPSQPFDANPAARAARLDVFDSLNPQGEWALFVADLEGGGEFVLDSWRLDLTVVPVPEPIGYGLAVAALLAGFAACRLRQR